MTDGFDMAESSERTGTTGLEQVARLLSEALLQLDQGGHTLIAAHLSGVLEMVEKMRR